MDYKLTKVFPNKMLLKSGEPCLSLYMPTHRLIFDNKRDVLVFKNLVKEAKESFEKRYSTKEIEPLMTLLKDIEEDGEFWNYSQEGLALFATFDEMIIYRLEEEVKPIAIVSNSFHIKPLIKYYQNIEEFNLLALEANAFAIYEGNHLDIKPVELSKETETSLKGVLGNQHTESYQTHGAYGGASDGSVFHGHGGRSDEIEIDQIKFFKYVDQFVLENISKQSKKPLILVAHKEHHHDIRNLSNNPYLLEESIKGAYQDFDEKDMKDELRQIMTKRFNAVIDEAKERFHNLRQKDLSSDQLIIVLKALLEARVDTLFIEEDKIIPGKIDVLNQQIIESNLENPQTDDILDDMIQHALTTGTLVYVLDKEDMPTESAVAAIFRY